MFTGPGKITIQSLTKTQYNLEVEHITEYSLNLGLPMKACFVYLSFIGQQGKTALWVKDSNSQISQCDL